MKISIEFDPEELKLVHLALTQLPFGRVEALVHKVRAAARKAMETPECPNSTNPDTE